jgi:phenylacetate-CoA ligase
MTATDPHRPSDPVEIAVRLVQSIALTVPAYRTFLTDHGIDADTLAEMTDLTALPATSKESYRRGSTLTDLQHGRPDDVEVIACSAGSSGTPTFWSRGHSSTDHGASMFGQVLRETADTETRTALAVVAFPFGQYVGGIFMVSMLFELQRRKHRLAVATPGMDTAAIAQIIEEAADGYDQIVIFSYPPILRDLLDTHGELMRRHHVSIIVGGEPVSEAWRTLVHIMLEHPDGDLVRVVYGATDVGFVGYETAGTVAIRAAAAHDPALNSAMFGAENTTGGLIQQPAFVQYRPDHTYIEVDSEGYLLFTVGGVLPLVRYRVNDRGELLDGSQIQSRLQAAGYDTLADGIDPSGAYLLVHGRTDVSAIFNAVNLYPDYFRPAVEHISLATRLTGRFIAYNEPDADQRQTLILDAELRPGQQPDVETAHHLSQLAVASLRQLSAEYRVVHDQRGHTAEPVVRLKPFHSDGFVTDGKQNTTR